MGTTPRFGIPYPEESDPNDVPLDVLEAVTKIDTDAAIDMQGLYSARPPAAKRGLYYYATDQKLLYRDNGSQWVEISRGGPWVDWSTTVTREPGFTSSLTVDGSQGHGRYKIVQGSICIAQYARLWSFGGSPDNKAVLLTLPVAPAQLEWGGSAYAQNDIATAIVAADGLLYVRRPAGINSGMWLAPSVATWTRLTLIYEIAENVLGGTPGEGEGGPTATPSGPAGGDLSGDYPNPTVKATVVTSKSLSQLGPPTANLPMNNKKTTGQAKGTASTDGATVQNIADHEAATDPHAAASYAKMVGGGRRIHVVTSSDATTNVIDGDVEVSDTAVKKRVGGAWQTVASGAGPGGSTTNPTTPGSGTDVDRRADLTAAITQFFAEFTDGTGRVKVTDESVNKVTSHSQSLGMLFAVLSHNQAKFDLFRDWANATLKRSLNSLTFAPNIWAKTYTIGTGVTEWDANYGADYIRASALARACQLWGRQKDYDDYSRLAKDLEECSLNTDEGRSYQVSDNLQKTVPNGHHTISGGMAWEMNPGKLNMLAHRQLKLFTGKAIWDQVLAGDYDVHGKWTNNAGGVATSVGLPPDWASYQTNTHDPAELLNGTNGWAYSRSRNYSWEALSAIMQLYVDWKVFAETRARDLLSGSFKTWAVARWGTTNKFVISQQQSDGSELSVTRKLPFAYAGYFGMISNEPGNTTAANVKSTWLVGAKGTNGSGTYFKSDPPDVAVSSTYTGNSWMILMEAIDSGLYSELGEVPGIAGKYNATAGTTPGGGTSVPTTPLPPGAVKLAIDPNAQGRSYANALPLGTSDEIKKKSRFQWLYGGGSWSGQPMSFWSGPEWDGDGEGTEEYMAVCDAQSAWFQLTLYGIPNRDLGGASAGGSAGAIEYRNWTNAIISKIGTRPGIIVIEPDSIALMLGQSQADFDARMALIDELVTKLRNQCPNARLYLDAAHAAWFPDPSPLVPGLQKAGVAKCHGIVSNVSNFRTDAEVIPWSENLLGKLNLPNAGFIWDSGRNGKNPAPDGADWQNPLFVRFGRAPQYGGTIVSGNTRAHGVLYIKRPGESDGNNDSQGRGDHGGLGAGTFDSTYLYVDGAADNANGSESGNFVQGTDNAGLLQRPPTQGTPPVPL